MQNFLLQITAVLCVLQRVFGKFRFFKQFRPLIPQLDFTLKTSMLNEGYSGVRLVWGLHFTNVQTLSHNKAEGQ